MFVSFFVFVFFFFLKKAELKDTHADIHTHFMYKARDDQRLNFLDFKSSIKEVNIEKIREKDNRRKEEFRKSDQ